MRADRTVPFTPSLRQQLEEKHTQQMQEVQRAQEQALSKVARSQESGVQTGDALLVGGTNPSGAVVVDHSDVQITEKVGKFAHVAGADLQELVNALNALGATTRDMIAILENMKAAGALQAEVITK